ncbi:MAG: hypothetical protein WBB29_04570 [Geitlerinemataceae cyanobacterium]
MGYEAEIIRAVDKGGGGVTQLPELLEFRILGWHSLYPAYVLPQRPDAELLL